MFEVLLKSGSNKGNQFEFRKHPNKHATFIYAINGIQKFVRLAQLVEQWNGNPEVRVRVT